MRKVLATVFTVALFAVFGASSAVAAPNDSSSPCPDPSPNSAGTPACGVDHNAVPNPGCGNGQGSHGTKCPPPPPPAAACGPADQGGTAADGPVSSIVYQVGKAISDGGGAPLGDAVQQIACALDTNLGL